MKVVRVPQTLDAVMRNILSYSRPIFVIGVSTGRISISARPTGFRDAHFFFTHFKANTAEWAHLCRMLMQTCNTVVQCTVRV